MTNSTICCWSETSVKVLVYFKTETMDEVATHLDSLGPHGLLSGLLCQCISEAEKWVHQMDLSNIRLMLFGYCLAKDQMQVELRPRILPAVKLDPVKVGLRASKTGEGMCSFVLKCVCSGVCVCSWDTA